MEPDIDGSTMPCDRRARVTLLASYIALIDAASRAADPPAGTLAVGPNNGCPLLSRPRYWSGP